MRKPIADNLAAAQPVCQAHCLLYCLIFIVVCSSPVSVRLCLYILSPVRNGVGCGSSVLRPSPGRCPGALDPAVMGRGVACCALLVRKFGTEGYMLENPKATQICSVYVSLTVAFGMSLCLGTGPALGVLGLAEDAR